MEEIYIVKLKGLPSVSTDNNFHGSNLTKTCRLPNDRKTAFYLTTDLTAEAVRGLSYLHIFLGFTILCLSITNLCFNENPWSLEPPLGITLWCSLTFVVLGFFGLLAAHQRQCNLSRSIVYVRVYFLLIIIAISVTLTFVILFILDLHGPIANHLIGMNILFSILVETIVLFLTLFTCARILWPSCIGFCAKDWPMQANLKRKVIVKTKVFASSIDGSDEAIQSVGPNCVISLNMPPAPLLGNIENERNDMSTMATVTSPITSPNTSTLQLPFERTSSPKILGCQRGTMTTSATTLHTIQSCASTVDSGHYDEHHNHHHHRHLHQLSSSASSSSSQYDEHHHQLSYGLQSAISSQSINHPHLGSSNSFPLQTFTKSTSSGLQTSSTNMNQLLYQSTILRRTYLANSDVSFEQQSNKSDNHAQQLYDSDEFDYCTTDEEEDRVTGVVGTDKSNGIVDVVAVGEGGGEVNVATSDIIGVDSVDSVNGINDIHASAVDNISDDTVNIPVNINIDNNIDNNINNNIVPRCHEIAHRSSIHHNDDCDNEAHHVRSLSVAGSDRTSSDEGHGSVDSSSDDAKSESNKSVTDEAESADEMNMKIVSNNNDTNNATKEKNAPELMMTLDSFDEGIGGETMNNVSASISPIHSLKSSFIGNYEKCTKIPTSISIPKASIQKSDINSTNVNRPTSIRVLSNSKEKKNNSSTGDNRIATTTTLLKTYGSKLSSHPYLSRLKATSTIGESAILDRRNSKDKTSNASSFNIPDIERV